MPFPLQVAFLEVTAGGIEGKQGKNAQSAGATVCVLEGERESKQTSHNLF